MKTNNIISTPNITGNIGSCKSELTQVYNNVGWLNSQGVNIVTNSCTGKVTQTSFEEVSVGGFLSVILFGIVLIVGVLGWLASL